MKFGVFIVSHGRADNVITAHQLRVSGYTGPFTVVIDSEDDQREQYLKNFDDVVIFDKSKVVVDLCDNFPGNLAVVYPRNYIPELAKERGLDYFLVLDDDYKRFEWRFIRKGRLRTKQIKSLDGVFDAMLDFLEVSGAYSVAMAQGGDFIGGGKNKKTQKHMLLRKVMNSFFCKTERDFRYIGRINEDVNTYCVLGMRGRLFFTATGCMLQQTTTQVNPGGQTALYAEVGTYIKSFYSVMVCPGFIKITVMGDKHLRIHHDIDWPAAVPKIISEDMKK